MLGQVSARDGIQAMHASQRGWHPKTHPEILSPRKIDCVCHQIREGGRRFVKLPHEGCEYNSRDGRKGRSVTLC